MGATSVTSSGVAEAPQTATGSPKRSAIAQLRPWISVQYERLMLGVLRGPAPRDFELAVTRVSLRAALGERRRSTSWPQIRRLTAPCFSCRVRTARAVPLFPSIPVEVVRSQGMG